VARHADAARRRQRGEAVKLYLRLAWPRSPEAALAALKQLFSDCRILGKDGKKVLAEGQKDDPPTLKIVSAVGIKAEDVEKDPPKEGEKEAPKEGEKEAPKPAATRGFVFIVECESVAAVLLLTSDNGRSIIARPYLEPTSEPKCPNTSIKGEVLPCKKLQLHDQPAAREELAINEEMIRDYLEDLKLIGTYAGEAEAALVAERLTITEARPIGFNVCEDTNIEGVLRYVHSFGPDGDLWLRFSANHYRVVERDPEGPLTVIRTRSNGTFTIVGRFREHAVDSRVDGSCLFDSCHIAVYGVSAPDQKILDYRGVLAATMSGADVRHILTTLAYDLAHGIAIPGLGKNVGARLQPFLEAISKRRSCRVRGSGLTECKALASHAALDGVAKLKGPLLFTLPKDASDDKISSIEIANALLGKEAKSADLVLANPSALPGEGGYLVTTFCTHCDEVTFLHVIVDCERDVKVQEVEVFLGPEYTFTNEAMRKATEDLALAIAKRKKIAVSKAAEEVIETFANKGKRDDWWKLLDKEEPIQGAKLTKTKCKENDAFKVTLKEGWWFQVTLDPSCLEIQTGPMTLATLRQHHDAIQTHIFDVAKKTLKLEDHRNGGGGHMHLGILRSFGRDSLLFRNFFVDLCNNPLVLVAFDDDTVNAPTLRERPRVVQEAFAEGLKEMDQQFLDASPASGQELIVAFARMIHGEKIYGCHEHGFSGEDAPHYQALNVERILKQPEVSRTIEVRRLRAQESVDEFILVGEMFEARIRYLQEAYSRELIAFEAAKPIGPAYVQVNVERALKQYLAQAGINDSGPYLKLVRRNFEERGAQ
jgi:hypothetical protein